MLKCDQCGGLVDETNYICQKCGQELTYKKRTEQIDMSVFQQTNSTSKHIYEPSLWMYILSCFNPVLQSILMGVYVSKNDFDSAFKLWLKPLIAQVIIIVIAIIAIAVISGV